MPRARDLDPSSSPRALLGAEPRHAREKAGLSQEEPGQRLFVSGSFIGQLEIPVRDSKNPHGPKLVFRATAWAAFVENLKDETA